MTTAYNAQAWSKTAASNSGADAGIGLLADTSFPNTVDNWWRGDMAAFRRYVLDTCGGIRASGSANVITATTFQNLDSGHLADGLTLMVWAKYTNTSATVTFSPDGHTARAIKTANGAGLVTGQIKAGAPLILVYRAAGTPVWHCVNLQPATVVGASACSFFAHKNGFDQSLNSGANQLTFGIEDWDIGSAYASHAWTPPAGTVKIIVKVSVRTGTDATPVSVALYKDGVEHRKITLISPYFTPSFSTEAAGAIETIEQVDGTNAFTVYATRGTSAAVVIEGKENMTYFCGTMV